MNKAENTTYQNLWDATKAGLRGKFIAVNDYIIKEKKSHIKNVNLYLKELEKEEQTKSKTSKKKKIIRSEIFKLENRENQQNQRWFFRKSNKN